MGIDKRVFLKLLLFSLLVFLPAVSAQEMFLIDIVEKGKVTSYYDDYYIVQIYGNITLTNTQNSSLYNIEIPFRLPGLQIRALNSTGKANLFQTVITIFGLDPNESITFPYKISGITVEEFRTDQALLKTAIEARGDTQIYSNLLGSLSKSEIETHSTGSPGRLITFQVVNPSAYRFKIDEARVIKTPGMDPNSVITEWNFPDDITEQRVGGKSIEAVALIPQPKPFLLPYERWTVDFFDDNATEGEVYWLSTDIYIQDILVTGRANITRYDQDDLYIIISNVTNITENVTDIEFLEDRIFLRKFVSDRQMSYGKSVDITLLINNLDSSIIKPKLLDSVPEGFTFGSVGLNGTVNGRNLTWDGFEVPARGSIRIEYKVTYEDNDSVGLDYFLPAALTWKGDTIYSQTIPFVRKYIPEKKLFVQKKVKFLNDDDIEVIITLQNLGESPLVNLVLKEFLSTENEFKEVTQKFESKGVWKIPSIEQGATWETSYVTDRTNVLNSFPEVFGVPTNSVMKTIIMSHELKSSLSIFKAKTIELIGIIVILFSVLYYFFPPHYLRSRRKRDVKKVAVIENELAKLRYQTGTPKEKIEEGHEKLVQRYSKKGVPKAAVQPKDQKSDHKKKHDSFENDLQKNKEMLDKMKETFED